MLLLEDGFEDLQGEPRFRRLKWVMFWEMLKCGVDVSFIR
jgi:hypothetical protein